MNDLVCYSPSILCLRGMKYWVACFNHGFKFRSRMNSWHFCADAGMIHLASAFYYQEVLEFKSSSELR